jgi:hypothetical protein
VADELPHLRLEQAQGARSVACSGTAPNMGRATSLRAAVVADSFVALRAHGSPKRLESCGPQSTEGFEASVFNGPGSATGSGSAAGHVDRHTLHRGGRRTFLSDTFVGIRFPALFYSSAARESARDSDPSAATCDRIALG